MLAAASNMSVNDYEGAFLKLFRAGEIYFAYVVAKLVFQDGLPLVYSYLSEKAEIYGDK